MPRSKPASHRRVLAALAAGAALVVMTIGSAAAARNQPGVPASVDARWFTAARMWLARAESIGADRVERSTLDGWLGLEDPNEATETPEPTETPEATETPEPKETPEAAHAPKPAKAEVDNEDDQGEDNDDQGENEQDHESSTEHHDAPAPTHHANQTGEHDGGDSGDHDNEGGD